VGHLVDSNVLIDYVADRFKSNQLKALDLIFDEEFSVSVMTKIEILGYSGVPEEEARMIEFLNYAEIIAFNEEVLSVKINLF